MLTRLARVVVSALAVLLGLAIIAPAPAVASGGGVFAGGCVVTLTLSAPGGLGVVPGAAAMHLDGGGTCVINGTVTTISITSPLGSLPAGFGCVAGAASGAGQVWATGMFDNSATIAVVNAGGVISIAIDGGIYIIAGTAGLLQDPLKTAGCIQGTPITSTTWTGALVIEDPTVPDPPS